MPSDLYSGNSAYQFNGTASRSGTSITVAISATKLSGSGYWTNGSNPWAINIGAQDYSGTWSYDFRGGAPMTLQITSRTRSSLTPGNWGWGASSTLDNGIGSASVSGSVTVPVNSPSAPTIGTITRNSDTSHTVAWTRNASVSAPYTAQLVQRRDWDGFGWNSWTTVATIGTDYTTSGAQSYTDTTTIANRLYQWRIGGQNASGTAYSAASGNAFTTPGTPKTLVAEKQSSGSIILTWTDSVTYSNYTTTLEYSTNGGSSWSALTSTGSGVQTYTHASPPAGSSIIYRARTVVNASGSVGHGLTSGWRQSNTVPLTAPPLTPSNLSPSGIAYDADDARTFTWKHNTADSSAQTAYSLRYRIVGAPTWTTIAKTTSTSQSRSMAGGTFVNGNVYEWQVQTWGAHTDPSPWSASATFTASNPPSATITNPVHPYGSALVNATWTYFDPEGTAQSSWEAKLFKNDVVIESRSGSGAATSTTFNTRLDDDTEYELQVRVRDGSLLWSAWDSIIFTTSFPQPPVPSFTMNWDQTQGSVQLSITNPAPGVGEVAATYNVIERSTDGEEWTVVNASAPVSTTSADPEAPLNQELFYRVTAWSDLPSASAPVSNSIVVPGDMGYWNAGAGFGVALQLRVGFRNPPKIDLSSGLAQKSLHYFAGRTRPVEFSGTAVLREGSVEFMVTSLEEKRIAEVLSLLPAPHLFRLPDGLHMYASIEPVDIERIEPNAYTVSTSVVEVEK